MPDPFRAATIRLAHAHPELRAHLLPLVARIAPRNPMSPVTEPHLLSDRQVVDYRNVLYTLRSHGGPSTKRFMDSMLETLKHDERFTKKQVQVMAKILRETKASEFPALFGANMTREKALTMFDLRNPMVRSQILREKADWWKRRRATAEFDDCPLCGGTSDHINSFRGKHFYRCRDCGMEFSEDGIEPGRGMAASEKNDMKNDKALRAATIRLAHAAPDLRPHLLALLASEDEDEKEGKFERGEDVPLDKMPKELQENVENPPESVKEVTEKIKNKGQSNNKPPGKRASLLEQVVRLAHAKPHLRAHLLPLLASADEDEKEGKFERGEDVSLKDMPKELQENVENPPESVKEVTEKIKNKGQSNNKPPGKRGSLLEQVVRLAHAKPELRGKLLPVLKEARRWPSPTEPEPSDAELERMVYDSVVDATDGCQVEPDGVCQHGHPSWLMYMGLV